MLSGNRHTYHILTHTHTRHALNPIILFLEATCGVSIYIYNTTQKLLGEIKKNIKSGTHTETACVMARAAPRIYFWPQAVSHFTAHFYISCFTSTIRHWKGPHKEVCHTNTHKLRRRHTLRATIFACPICRMSSIYWWICDRWIYRKFVDEIYNWKWK